MNRAAPLRPATRQVWIVRWVRADGTETRHRMFLRHYPAKRFHRWLVADGRTAALFATTATWRETP